MKLVKISKILPAKYESYTEAIYYNTQRRVLIRLKRNGKWELIERPDWHKDKLEYCIYNSDIKPDFVELKDYKEGIINYNLCKYIKDINSINSIAHDIQAVNWNNREGNNSTMCVLGNYLIHKSNINKLLNLYPYLVNQYREPVGIKHFNQEWMQVNVSKIQLNVLAVWGNITPINVSINFIDIPSNDHQRDCVIWADFKYIFQIHTLQPSYIAEYSKEFYDIWERDGYVSDYDLMNELFNKLNHVMAKFSLYELTHDVDNWSFSEDVQPNYVDYEGLNSYTITKKGIFTFPKGITAEDVYEQDYEKYAELNNLILIK